MGNYQHPGIYVQEIAIAPNIEPVAACLPLFIGHTEKSQDANGHPLPLGKRYSVSSLAEYEEHFGKGAPETLRVLLDGKGNIVNAHSYSPFYLYAAVQQYFANGGGQCEILSVGPYSRAPDASALKAAIRALPPNAAFTLVAIPDAVSLAELPQLQRKLLQYCAQQDYCLAILDVPYCNDQTREMTVNTFRHDIGQRGLQHGAAFMPWLETAAAGISGYVDLEIKYTPGVATAWNDFHKATKLQSHLLHKQLEASPAIRFNRMIPPSGSIMALFEANARKRNIWTTPHHTPIKEIISLSATIDNVIQESLNIHPTGKSINAIRRFDNAVLMWGGRTLASNDSEWRYIAHLLTRGFVQASLRRFLDQQNFEQNDEATWSLVGHQCQDFLHTLWREGALVGDKPEQAFYVRIGLNQTMSTQDIAAGRMIVHVGIALLRPAEFIILKLHKVISAPDLKPAITKPGKPVNRVKIRAKTSPINVVIRQRQQPSPPSKPLPSEPVS
ncbi:phage tail sheath C-terminal domain-containing protein [Methylobacillus sp.]|uniref:phage tail sheath family protein n=1 Tax=Methylobacillus sp. TaxID=56818 RepID=UPI0012D1BC04|nr:phage tail sheath C-terminal domain-containing protein [Methylobacillus sp.]MPS48122.1 phage tail sheath family protein [Methylobacillus sp.]